MQHNAVRTQTAKRLVSRMVGAFGLTLIALSLGAQVPASGSSAQGTGVHRLEDVEVRARSLEDPVREPLAVAPSQSLTLDVIDREDIERLRPRTACDALNGSPGMEVRTKGRKNALRLTLRGEGTVNVLFDGLGIGAEQDYRFLYGMASSLVEEIRVIRDSSSLVYETPLLTPPCGGALGFGGVVDVRPRDPADEYGGEIRTEFGRFGDSVQHLHLSGPLGGRLGYVLSADRDHYDGPSGENMEHTYESLMGRLVYRYTELSTAALTVLHQRGNREIQRADPKSYFSFMEQEFDPLRATTTTLRINHVWTPDVSTSVETYYRDNQWTEHNYHFSSTPLGPLEADLRESKWGTNVRQTIRSFERNTLRLGGQFSYWNNPTGKMYWGGWAGVPSKPPSIVLRTFARREKDYGLYAQDELVLLPGRLTVDAGVRWDRKHIEKGFSSTVVPAGDKALKGVEVPDTWLDPVISTSTGVKLDLTPSQTVTARFAVSRESLTGQFQSSDGQALDTAKETRYELGYENRLNDRVALTLTGFRKRISNGLEYDGLVGDVPFYRATDFDRYGFEAGARGAIARDWDYFVSMTYLHGEKEAEDGGQDPEDKLPNFMLSGGVQYGSGPWQGALTVHHTEEYEENFGTFPSAYHDVGDYWLVGLNVSYTIERDRLAHEVYAGVRNLANERYETYPGWKDPGRSVYVGYSLRF